MKKARTTNYLTTLNPLSQEDMKRLESIRASVKLCNILNKTRGTPPLRVSLRGRLGKNNPMAVKYKTRRDYQMIDIKDSQRIDVYIHEKR